MQPKDVVTAIGGERVRHFHLQILIARHLAGEGVELVVQRGGETVRRAVVLGELPEAEREAEKKGRIDDPLPWEGPPGGGR